MLKIVLILIFCLNSRYTFTVLKTFQLLFKSSLDNSIANAFVFAATYSCHYSVPVSTQQRSDLQLCRLCMAVLHIVLNTHHNQETSEESFSYKDNHFNLY